MDDFTKYERMRDLGATPPVVYQQALANGVDRITVVRLLRSVFGLDLVQAKEAMAIGDGAESLSEHQQTLVPGVEKATRED
jgi:hypothetical protein